MRKLFRKGDAFRLVGERSRRTEAERETLDKAGADAAFRAGQRRLYEDVLRPAGFLRWKGGAFARRSPEDWLAVIELQKERHGSKTFTVNCMAVLLFLPGAEPDMTFAERLGVLAVGRDVWWDFAPAAAEGSFRNVGEALRRFGLPWFERLRGDGARKALLREGDRPWAKAWLAALDARGRDIPAERETVRENCRRLKLPKGLLREDEK